MPKRVWTADDQKRHNKYNREVWYPKHRAEQIKRAKRAKAQAKAAAQELIARLKSVPCMDCDHCFPTCVMDFDHVRGEKVIEIAVAVSQWSIERILEEIAKCEIVCANCHRVRTHSRRVERLNTLAP